MLIIEKQVTGSTQDDALQLAEEGADHMTVVWAQIQTAGRGRYSRKWESMDGNVLWSIILRPQPDWPSYLNLVFVNALAVRRAVFEEIGNSVDIELKWPNDIIVGGYKVAGSLLQSGGTSTDGRSPGYIVIGTGINVSRHPDGEGMLYPPNSLAGIGFHLASRNSLIGRLNSILPEEIERWSRLGFSDVRERYLSHAHRLHHEITVGTSADKSTYKTGIYKEIDETGRLVLQTKGGDEKLNAGDVILKVG